jgi:4a-hydroxytetrahydrobiopterin dehydratase
MPALPDDLIAERLAALPDWDRVGDEIVKRFEFRTFPEAIAFVDRLSVEAEAANHDPDIDIRYNRVRIALTTHDEGGISALDFSLAEAIERVREG